MPDAAPVLLWFRRDLRLDDHPALTAAAAAGRPLLPVFILEEEAPWAPGGAARWWLHRSLAALAETLAARGLPLILRRGDPVAVLPELAAAVGATAVHWSRRYEPDARAHDRRVSAALREAGVEAGVHPGALLSEPWTIATGQGGPYRVFTPYARTFGREVRPGAPLPEPRGLRAPAAAPPSPALSDLGLDPGPLWGDGLAAAWTPGEAGARALLGRFLDGPLAAYAERRDLPARTGTSRLSPHLHWGEISPRRVWHAAAAAGPAAEPFLRQLVWREFAHHLLHHFPHTVREPLRAEFAAFPWDGDPGLLPAWRRGETGYPLVDAGMRELWTTGWMHNRVRMVVASFLVKHLLLPWQEGAAWFLDTLVDADQANNVFGWQWSAGCGADAAPYFRVFNPVLQSRRFDPDGAYLRRWLPELAALDGKAVHAPWEAGAAALRAGGVELGKDYPRPVVHHVTARERALAAYRRMRGGS